eukprot:11008453-Ditylum_brightwellii.AAC.1
MLGLIIIPAAYHTLTGADFVTPIRPAPPVIPSFAFNVQVTEIMQVYNESLWTYIKYVATAKALKTQLLGAFHDDYFLAIYDQVTGYKVSMVLELLQHLYANYGQLDSTQLTANNDKIRADYDPTAPIEKYIAQVEKCMDIAANGGAPFSLQQILTITFDD